MKIKQSFAINLMKFLKIIFQICRVVCIIGLVASVLAAIVVPTVGSQIKKSDNKITIFGEDIVYDSNEDNEIEINYNGSSTSINVDESGISANELVKDINNLSIKKCIIVIEFYVIYGIGTLIFLILILKKFIVILKNTIDKETPFIDSNPEDLCRTSKLLFELFIYSVVAAILISIIVSKDFEISIDSSALLSAMIIYIIAWGVEKGNSKHSIKTEKVKESKKTSKK